MNDKSFAKIMTAVAVVLALFTFIFRDQILVAIGRQEPEVIIKNREAQIGLNEFTNYVNKSRNNAIYYISSIETDGETVVCDENNQEYVDLILWQHRGQMFRCGWCPR